MKILQLVLVLTVYSFANWFRFDKHEPHEQVNYQGQLIEEMHKVMNRHDSMFLNRKPKYISTEDSGTYLGIFKGVQCVNCIPNMINILVSDSGNEYVMVIKKDVWKEVPKPIKDKRIYEYGNSYFYFGYNKIDTVFAMNMKFEEVKTKVTTLPYIKLKFVDKLVQRF